MAPLLPRQSTTTTSCSGGLSGGAVAGIVLGTIAGTLLLYYLIKTCFWPGSPLNRHPEERVMYSSTTVPSSHRRRRSHRDYRGPDYVDYVEKTEPVRVARSRTRRGSVASVSRPERVYVSN